MSKEQTKELDKFLKPFDKEIIDLVMWLRDFAWPKTKYTWTNYCKINFWKQA